MPELLAPAAPPTCSRLGGLSAAALTAEARARGLHYPEHLAGQLVAALETGRHVVLTGPPGTGKTTLAHLAAELACGPGGAFPATAAGSWTTADTIGETVPGHDGPVFRPGSFVRALDEGRWLLIDELNRADMDSAFGALFTVLSGQSVVLAHRRNSLGRPLSIVPAGVDVPHGTEAIRVPAHWRIIATMNDFDKESLHGLSHALMRRFAFVEVLAPDDDDIAAMIAGPGDVVAPLIALRRIRELGPALFLDAAAFAARRGEDGCSPSRVRYEALSAYLLPQLDGLDVDDVRRLQAITDPVLEAAERDQLARACERMLGAAA